MTQIQNFGFIALSELLGISDKIIQLFSNHLFWVLISSDYIPSIIVE